METLLTIYLAVLTALACFFGALAVRAWRRSADAESRARQAEAAVEEMVGALAARRRARTSGKRELAKMNDPLRSPSTDG